MPIFFSFLVLIFLTIMKVSFTGDSDGPVFLLQSHKEEVGYLYRVITLADKHHLSLPAATVPHIWAVVAMWTMST